MWNLFGGSSDRPASPLWVSMVTNRRPHRAAVTCLQSGNWFWNMLDMWHECRQCGKNNRGTRPVQVLVNIWTFLWRSSCTAHRPTYRPVVTPLYSKKCCKDKFTPSECLQLNVISNQIQRAVLQITRPPWWWWWWWRGPVHPTTKLIWMLVLVMINACLSLL